MSYKKKRNPAKPEKSNQQMILEEIGEMEFEIAGASRKLPINRLNSGLPYQRPIKEQYVDHLVQHWNNRLLQPLIVSFRNGKFNLIDGQHRLAAMRRLAQGKDVIAPCLIFTGMTYEDEAEMYVQLERAKGRLSLSQSLKVQAESGKDVEIATIKRLMEDNGFTWALGRKSTKAYEISVTRTVINAYHLLGPAAFGRMLRLLGHTWHGDNRSLSAAMIAGLSLFLKTYEMEVNDNAFVKSLSAFEADRIIDQGKLDHKTSSLSLRFARVMWDKYNSQQQEGRKLPYRFRS